MGEWMRERWVNKTTRYNKSCKIVTRVVEV